METAVVPKPSDFNTSEHFWNSPFQEHDMEMIARNIVIVSKRMGDTWKPFTKEEYAKHCDHPNAMRDTSVFFHLEKFGVLALDRTTEQYSVTPKFFEVLRGYLK